MVASKLLSTLLHRRFSMLASATGVFSLVKSSVEVAGPACRWQRLWAFCGHCGRRILVTVSLLTA